MAEFSLGMTVRSYAQERDAYFVRQRVVGMSNFCGWQFRHPPFLSRYAASQPPGDDSATALRSFAIVFSDSLPSDFLKKACGFGLDPTGIGIAGRRFLVERSVYRACR